MIDPSYLRSPSSKESKTTLAPAAAAAAASAAPVAAPAATTPAVDALAEQQARQKLYAVDVVDFEVFTGNLQHLKS